ncbi:hypothetical protein I4F81_011312 [Pyropia yezoensis]|uniref:Uncharacterized protein n=1 Tax=Pyropia yezoensis TaxID=2788 RepID=A0ACC3CF53_PYRYE|nr:hypothetical protein I4F81_011312 [Neopyropia yezoensis]|eukprot:contig_2436_g456
MVCATVVKVATTTTLALALALSVSAALCNDATCCALKANTTDELELVDPFKVCTIPDSPADLGGGTLTLVCLNGGGSLFNSCTNAVPLKHIPVPPPSMPVCSLGACRNASKELIEDRVCRFLAAYSYPITCDFWSRTVGMQEIKEAREADEKADGLPVRTTARQELREIIHTALQALASKHFWVHQRRTRGTSTV